MSTNYADGLSPYPNKGQVGLPEKFDNASMVSTKVEQLAKWINKSKHVVLHTGAGISTSAGIPDFRGPRGVWTLEAKGQKPDLSKDFNEAVPTFTHMAVARLVDSGKVKYVVSQNIDGLHLRSGMARKYLSELHGNMFIEQCNACNRQFVRNKAVPTVGQKSLNKACPTIKANGRACRGRLHDSILDWEHSLPENDLAMADFHSCMADLSIAIGTTMQIVPSGSLPVYTKRAGGKLVIINLQPTKHDKKADLIIHGYADEVMTKLMKQLSLRTPKYSPSNDPTRLSLSSDRYFDWTITDATTAQMRKIYEAKCGTDANKKISEVIDEDEVPLGERMDKGQGRKRKSDEGGSKRSRRDDDDDLELVEEIPRSKRGRPKKNPEVASPTKLTIKKAPGQTKYEIVKAKRPNVEIVRESVGELCGDLEMVCESDDDGPIVFTTNFRRYLHDDKTFQREEKQENVPDGSQDKKEESKDPPTESVLASSQTTESQDSSDAVKNEETEKTSTDPSNSEEKDGSDGATNAAQVGDECATENKSVAAEHSSQVAGDASNGTITDEKEEIKERTPENIAEGEENASSATLDNQAGGENSVAEKTDASGKSSEVAVIESTVNPTDELPTGQVDNNEERRNEELLNAANDGNNNRSNVAIENDVVVEAAAADGQRDPDVQRMAIDTEGQGGSSVMRTSCIAGEAEAGTSPQDTIQPETLPNSTGTASSVAGSASDINILSAAL